MVIRSKIFKYSLSWLRYSWQPPCYLQIMAKKIVLSIREMWVCWCGRNKSVALLLLCPICLQTPLSPLLQAFSTSASPWPLPTNAGESPLLPLISYCLMDHCSILPHCPSSFPCNLSASGLKSFVQLHF